MNNEKENSGLFTAGDIERYHRGGMPPAEMHTLERAALDDPFLADALEGYAFTPTPASDIDLLKDKLHQRLGQRKGAVPLFTGRTWVKAAAVILVIGAGSWLIVNNFKKKESGLAVERSTVSTKDSLAEAIAPSLPSSSVTADTGFFDDSPTPRNKEISSGKQNRAVKKDQESSKGKADERQTQPATTMALPPSPVAADEKKEVPETPPLPPLQKAEAVAMNRKPDINAMMKRSVPAGNEAEAFGKQAQKLNAEVGTKADTVRNFNVVMEPDNGLTEVVVLNKGKKVASGRPEPVIDTLEPEPGWSSYDDYIAANIKTPQQLQIKPQQGTVELSFDINKNGDPVNVQVTKSLCSKCDEEAIRLLKEGPKWKKKKSRKGKIAIQF